ncbi:8020_t:CDS:2, partial [Ambispora gerdemannii]
MYSRDIKSPVWFSPVLEPQSLGAGQTELQSQISSEPGSRTEFRTAVPDWILRLRDEKTAKEPGPWFLGTNQLEFDPGLGPDL